MGVPQIIMICLWTLALVFCIMVGFLLIINYLLKGK